MTKLVEVDPGKLARGGVVVVGEDEHPDDRAARIRREEREHAQRLWKDKIVFGLVASAGAILFLICGYILIFGGNADSRELAKIGITALFTGLVSFLAGQQMK
jgi:hypothetical protein